MVVKTVKRVKTVEVVENVKIASRQSRSRLKPVKKLFIVKTVPSAEASGE